MPNDESQRRVVATWKINALRRFYILWRPPLAFLCQSAGKSPSWRRVARAWNYRSMKIQFALSSSVLVVTSESNWERSLASRNPLTSCQLFFYKLSHSFVSGFSQQAMLPNYRESEGLRFNVVIREDAKVSPFTDIIVKAALSTHLRPWVEVRPVIEPRSPNWYRRQRTTTLPLVDLVAQLVRASDQ